MYIRYQYISSGLGSIKVFPDTEEKKRKIQLWKHISMYAMRGSVNPPSIYVPGTVREATFRYIGLRNWRVNLRGIWGRVFLQPSLSLRIGPFLELKVLESVINKFGV